MRKTGVLCVLCIVLLAACASAHSSAVGGQNEDGALPVEFGALLYVDTDEVSMRDGLAVWDADIEALLAGILAPVTAPFCTAG